MIISHEYKFWPCSMFQTLHNDEIAQTATWLVTRMLMHIKSLSNVTPEFKGNFKTHWNVYINKSNFKCPSFKEHRKTKRDEKQKWEKLKWQSWPVVFYQLILMITDNFSNDKKKMITKPIFLSFPTLEKREQQKWSANNRW